MCKTFKEELAEALQGWEPSYYNDEVIEALSGALEKRLEQASTVVERKINKLKRDTLVTMAPAAATMFAAQDYLAGGQKAIDEFEAGGGIIFRDELRADDDGMAHPPLRENYGATKEHA